MNKMQWAAAAVSAVSISVLALGASVRHPMTAGPVVETSPGIYAHEFVDETVAVPRRVALTAAALFVVAGVLLYSGWKQRKS